MLRNLGVAPKVGVAGVAPEVGEKAPLCTPLCTLLILGHPHICDKGGGRVEYVIVYISPYNLQSFFYSGGPY